MDNPPAFDHPSQLVTWMISLAFLAVMAAFTKKLGSSGARPDETKAPSSTPEREAIEQRYGVSTDDMSDTLAKVIARQERRLSRLEADNGALHADLKEARWDLGKIWAWIDAGMPDPPGPGQMPSYVDLERHHRN